MKYLLGTAIGLVGAVTVPVIPQDMEFVYAYQTVPQVEIVSATSTPKERKHVDTDGNGVISVAVFANKKGELVEVTIGDAKYEDMGKPDGYSKNPKRTEFVNLLESRKEAQAALSVGNTTSSQVGSAATSLTYAHNNNGNVLVVGVSSLTGGASPTSVTYNAVAMTKEVAGTDGTNELSILYSLGTPAAGSNNVVVTYGGLRNFGSSATSFLEGDTADVIGATSGATAFVNNTTPTRTMSTLSSGSIVIDNVIVMAARTATVGANQTQRTNLQIVGDGYILTSTEPAASPSSITMSWSLSGAAVNWTNLTAEVRAAPTATSIESDVIIFE